MQEELKNLAKALQESNLNHNVIFERAYKEESKKANYLTPSSFTACLCKMNSNLQHKGSRTALIVTEYQESIDNPLNPSTKIVMCNYKKLCNELDIIIQHKPRMNLFFQKLLELMRKGKNSLFSNLTNLDYNGSANTGKIDMEKFSQLFYNSTNTMITPEEAETLKSIYDSEGKKIIDHVALKNDFINYCNNANVKYDDLIAIKPYSQKEKAYLGRPVFVNFDYFMNKNQITDPRDFFRDYGMNEEACTVTRFSFYDAIHDFYPAISTQIYNMLEDEMQTDRKEAISVTRFIQRYEEIRKDIDRTSEYQFYGNSRTSYNPNKAFVFQYISRHFESKDGLREALKKKSAQYGYIEQNDNIKNKGFGDFLTDQKIDVAELDQRRLDDIFLHQDTQMYDLSELMAYNEQVHNPANNDIRDKGSKDILQLVKRMMNFTAHNKIKLFKAFIEADKDHDGLLVEEEFLKTTKFLLMPLDRKMNILELRYKEFGDSRVNYLSLLYDMYCLRSNWNSDGKDSDGGDNTLPEFLDFPHQKTPKRDDEIRKIMANFSFIMKKKEITSEAMVGEMVDMARSHSIRNSVILLKVIDIMEEELFKDSANMNMGASMLSNNSRTNKSDENYRHPLLSVFEIVDCLDIDNQGSILDYDIVHRLNNLLNSDLIDFSSKLLNAMETNNCHLEMLIDKTIVENRNVNLSKLKDVLQLKADIHPDLTQKMFKTISIAHLDEIPLDSLKTKLDREICILGQERPEVVKQYIYGPQASGHITADGIGVGDLIRQLHLNMERQKKTFKEVFFRDPTRRKMPKEEFKTIYQQFIVGQHSELEKLLKKITDNQNKTMIDLNILEAIYNSKYGKVVAEDPASLTVETTLKNLRQTVAIFGHSAITLFNSADSNASNSLDREEFFALLLRLDDTIKREETNLIFDKTDDDRSGSINFKEFEQLFNVNSKVLGQKLRVDAIKWAKDIFEEINTKLQDTGRTVEDAIKNKEKLAQVPISNLREMMKELNVTKYLEDESTANKFDNDLKATGRSDMIDFNAFKSFLYLFMPVSRREEAKEGVLTALLARYGNNAKKTVEGLNVKVDNDITRVEFCTVAKKICSQYSEAEINNTYSIIVGDVNKNDITVQDLIIFLENFIESKKQKATQDPNPTSNAAINKEFDQTREKIRRFFNYDSSRFSQDINLYANQRKIKMSVALDYLERATLKLTKEERDILSKKIDPNMNGIVDVDHITSLIFFGKANLSTLTVMHYSAQLQLFLQQVRNEINNTGKGSYEVFMRLDGKQDKVIDQNELSTAINTYGLVMDVNDQLEVFTAISQNRTFFTIEDFRKTLHGKKLEDLGQLVFEIQDKAKAEGKKSPEELFFPSKVEMPELDFNAFATNMLKVNKTWTYEVIDICFSKMDGDCTGKVGVDKFNNLISDYAILNDFKDYLVQYAQNHGKHLQEVFAIASFSDGMVKEDFKRFCKTITEGKFEETSVDKLFSKLDINNDGVISKMEMSHVYDLTERHLYSIREFTYFRNSIMDYCDQNSMSLQALYRKYAEGGILTIDQIMKLAEEVIKRNDFNPSNLRKAFDMDFNMKISLMEFKKALLNSSENVEELILSIRKELNKIGFSDNTNKAETDQALKKLDDVFEKYDLNRNGYLDFDEFKSFLKSTNLRLTFPQVQLIFDFINCNQDDKLSREEIFAVFYSKAQLSKHFLEIVQKFKLEFNKDINNSKQIFIRVVTKGTQIDESLINKLKLAKNSFHNFIQELVPDIDIVNSLAVGSNSNKIYNLMVSEQAVDVSFEEITSFCSAGEFTLEAVQHKSQELDAALWELKDACMTMKIDLFRVLAEVDKDRRGFVPHEIFTKHLITRQLVKKPETANLIANSFKPKLSKKVNIEKLVAQVNKLEINDTGAQKDRIRNSFIKLAQTKKCRLRDLFNSHCLEKKMDYGQFKDLIMEAGEANTPNFLLESIFKNDLKAYNNVITIYKFLSMFDKANRTKELAILFANHAPLFNFLRESCQKDNTTFYRKYVKASYTSTFIQEIEKLKIPETIKPDIKGFTELLESTAQPNQIDQLALQMLDESFEKGMDVALLHKPPTNPDIDEISKMSFTDLQEIQKDIKLFDDAIKEDKLDFEGMMKKYDTKKDGLIHEKDFIKFLSDDLGFETKGSKKIAKIKEYAGKEDKDDKEGKEKKIDYKKLWDILKVDIAQLKKDQDSRAKVEEEQKENLFALVSPIPTLTGDLATEMEQKKTILNFTLQPMKTQVTGLYASVKELNRDRLVDYLIPNAAHLPAAAISEKILNDFRDKIVKKDLDTWLLSFANERKEIFKSRLREVIFEGMEIKANPREMGVDEQYDLLFSQVAKSSQDLITKEQLAESFKRLGLNKSSIEVDQVFRSFKKATSENLTRDDFKRLMKHEYSSDMMKERLIKERLVQIINITDGFRQGYLSPAQITFIFERAGTKATQLEVEEFFKYCDVNEHKEIIVPSFINLVVYGPKEFNSTQDFLASGLVKLRSALQTNVVEQFKTLEHMPQHFIISFSEEEYLASPSRLPTGVLKPVLSDSKTYYSNLLPPVQAQEMNSYSRYKKYIKLNRHCHTYEIKLEKATGVPIPDNTIVSYNEIVGREIRIGIFDIKKNSFVGNIQNLECMWKFGYEDRLYFDKYNIEKEDIVIVRIPEFKPFEEYEEIEIQEVVKLPINPADSSQATNPPVVPPPGPMNVADPNNPNQPAHSLLQPVTNIVNSTLVDPSNPGTSQAINPVVAPQGPTPGLNPEGTQQIPPGQLPPGQPLQIPPGQLPPSPADQNQQPSNLPQPQPQPPAEPSFPGIPIIRRVKKPVQPPIYSLIFEIVYFVRKREVNSTVALSAGFGSLPLDSIEHETVQKVNLIGGGPYKDKMLQIYDGDVRTKRRGIIPSLSSLFEGKIKSILHVRTTRLRINSQIPTDFGEEIELLPDLGVFHYPQISVDSLLRQNMGRDAFPHYTAPALGVGLTLSTETYINAFCNIFCVPEFASMIVTFWSRLSKVLTDKNQSYESKLDAFKYLLNRLYALINATTFRMEKGAPQVSYYGEPEIQGIRRGLLLSELDNTFQFVNETLLNGKSKPVLEAKTLVRHGEAFIDPPEEVKHIGFSIDELLEDDGLM